MTEKEMGAVETRAPRLTGVYVLLAVVLVISLAGTALSAVLFFGFWRADAGEEPLGETRENDVTIAGEYVIRSTTAISDAYKSGSTDGLSDKDKETLDMAGAVLEEIIQDGMSDYEKEKAVYEWMTSALSSDSGLLTVIPTTQADCDNPYGVLKYHNAVCVGYATTFRLFMEMLDIPCMVVHNTELYHSWDLVQLDGAWYHTDIYSDAGTGSGSGSYAHFNLNDTMASSGGESWDMEFYPSADSLTYNVLYQDAREMEDVYQIPALIRQAVDDAEKSVSMKFPATLTETEAEIGDSMTSQIEDLLDRTYLMWNWYPVDDGYLYVVTIYRYDDELDSQISDEDREKMDQAIQDAFGDMEDDDWYYDNGDYDEYDETDQL
jgi:hypothetical protein